MHPVLTSAEASTVVQGGGVIAYPTEAVWGLGCDPLDEAAVLRLLSIKQRDVSKGLILIAADLDQLHAFVDLQQVPDERLQPMLASWPGPHTWIVPANAQAPRWITGEHRGIAVRVSAHPQVVALCRACGRALVSTSANLSGEPAVRVRNELSAPLLAAIDGLLQGETGDLQRPTTIRDVLTGQALRE